MSTALRQRKLETETVYDRYFAESSLTLEPIDKHLLSGKL